MVKVTIDNTEYDTENMSDNAKAQVASLQFLEAHISEIQNEIAVFETARRAYVQALSKSVK